MSYVLGVVLVVANVAACADEGGERFDAGGDLPTPAQDILGGEGSEIASLNFVVAGCSSLDDAHCKGPAPLSLRLSLVTSRPELMSTGRWSFGDGSEALGATAFHCFERPGRYTVSVAVRTPDGTLVASKKDFVVVEPVASGGACASDEVCASGHCVCHDGECPAPLDRGLCLASCASAACPEDEHCVLLGGTGPLGAPWRRDACYPGCTNDTQCLRAGFLCRLAPTRGGSWRRVCLPPFPGDIGHPCRRDDGRLDAGACLGGLCLPLGAGGYCSATCSPGSCPVGTRCVAINTVGAKSSVAVCLLRCGPGNCATDPWLACQEPGGGGELGFTVLGPVDPAGTTYCAARACSKDDACGLGGHCDLALGGYLGGYCAAP